MVTETGTRTLIRWFDDIRAEDVPEVGGKNASLGEMTRSLAGAGVRVPQGFATTAAAYRDFVAFNDLEPTLRASLAQLATGSQTLAQVGAELRKAFLAAELPPELREQIGTAYRELAQRCGCTDDAEAGALDVAVRSSATAEDLPQASFAGQQETFLNVRGEAALLDACRRCYASLFTDRAIAYRQENGFDHLEVALSIGVQRMVRSDRAGSGVLFTLDPETGFPDLVLINAAWGLGETVVQGTVNPDQYTVFKPLLEQPDVVPILSKERGSKEIKMVYRADDAAPSTGSARGTMTVPTGEAERRAFVLDDEQILTLARWGRRIEQHYGRPMDIEWALDETGELFIVQARPETVQSRRAPSALKTFRLEEPAAALQSKCLLSGLAVGQAVATGPVQVLRSVSELAKFRDGSVLVTEVTDPDWVPVLKRAAGVVTDRGGRTSHAAIVSREFGIPAIVGTGEATRVLQDGQQVTLSCIEGDQGHVYAGRLAFHEQHLDLSDMPPTRTHIQMNVASPAVALRWWRLPCRGVGLARMEYLINNVIQIHPLALKRFEQVEDADERRRIEELTCDWPSKEEYFVDQLARGIAIIAAAQYPHPVIVRMSDFKTNEYANLIGGRAFEPAEENPMLGWRGASRYYSDDYRDGFALECQAIRRVRQAMGFANVVVMIPFCRTPAEADRVLAEMAFNGLRRGVDDLRVYVMAEIPSNILEAEAFAERFDGFSIGSNDLTQLVLGVGRDSEKLAYLFDERSPSVLAMIRDLIERAHRVGKPVGICGQAPSDHPDFAEFLVEAGIDSISLVPDSVLATIPHVAAAERALELQEEEPQEEEPQEEVHLHGVS